jgi:hypothetical protein
MRCACIFLLAIVLAGCSPKAKPVGSTFTLASGIEVLSVEASANSSDEPYVRISADKNYLVINLREFFYRSSAIEQPWLSLPRNGIATLNIGTGESNEVIGNHSEFLQNIVIRIDRKRVPAGTVLSIYNRDTAEVLANHAAL